MILNNLRNLPVSQHDLGMTVRKLTFIESPVSDT